MTDSATTDSTLPDARVPDSAEPDGGLPDGDPPDADPACVGVSCGEFEFCLGGECIAYMPCGVGGACPAGEVCADLRCIPGTVDIDGDGYPAGVDCDETDPEIHPEQTELCNLADEDCDTLIDEGDEAALCESDPMGGVCMEGVCGCPAGSYDFDRSVPGCECMAQPGITEALDCAAAIDLGNFPDSGERVEVMGNAMPEAGQTWYRFRGVDGADTTCDNYHVRVLLMANPDNTFEFTVFRGSCGAVVECADEGFTDYNWATDFRQTIDGRLTGQCPCTAAGAVGVADRSTCEDDSADYFVRVRRRAGAALACDGYTLEVSNGLYDTP